MIKQFLAGIALLLIIGCHNTPQQAPADTQPAITIVQDTSFFPVTSFIKGQMRDFDSIDLNPLYIMRIKDRVDSQWLKREQLKSFLTTFLEPEIAEKNLKKYFTESKFNDLTLNAVTLSYTPTGQLPDSMTLQNWNVYIDPQTQQVKTIYLVKNIKQNNTSITQELTWKNNTSATIVNILNKPDGSSEVINTEKFIWSF